MDQNNTIRTGDSYFGGNSNLAGAFLIFKGGIIDKSQIMEWKSLAELFDKYDSVIQPKKINFPLIMNCTENINVALEQASQ